MRFLIYILFFVTPLVSISQSQKGVDEIFSDARELAFKGDRVKARELCRLILKQSPTYTDAQILLARTYAWDGAFDSAHFYIDPVLKENPEYFDALELAADVDLWNGNYSNALTIAQNALQVFTNDESFLFKKAKALNNLGRKKEAVDVLERLVALNPANRDAINYMQGIKNESHINRLGANYSLDIFSPSQREWHLAYLQYSRYTKLGTVVARVNYANRFAINDIQGEADAYLGTWKGSYIYLNAGISPGDVFPAYRTGAEIYQKLPKAFEASIGFRYLKFLPSNNIVLYTASVGKYVGNYWFSARTFLVPDKGKISQSYSITARKYLATSDDYIGVSAGLGYSPDDRIIVFDYYLKSYKLVVDYQKRLREHYLFSAGAGWFYEEYFQSQFRNRFNFNAGFSYIF